MKISWKDMNVGEFPLVDPGFYKVRIYSLDYGFSPKKQSPRIEIKSTIEEGEFAGSSLVDFLSLTETALWRVGLVLNACGMSKETIQALPDCDANSEEFKRIMNLVKERLVFWEVNQETYDGKTRNKVVNWMPIEDQEPIVYEENVPEWVKSKVKKSGLKND